MKLNEIVTTKNTCIFIIVVFIALALLCLTQIGQWNLNDFLKAYGFISFVILIHMFIYKKSK